MIGKGPGVEYWLGSVWGALWAFSIFEIIMLSATSGRRLAIKQYSLIPVTQKAVSICYVQIRNKETDVTSLL